MNVLTNLTLAVTVNLK